MTEGCKPNTLRHKVGIHKRNMNEAHKPGLRIVSGKNISFLQQSFAFTQKQQTLRMMQLTDHQEVLLIAFVMKT